jgi:predicted dienelactone hydrolase
MTFLQGKAALVAELTVLMTLVHAATADPGEPGPLIAGWRSVTVSRPNSSTFPAQLYYPATGTGGANAGLESSGGPYAAISFGHGFLQPVDRYHSTLAHLATWGFIVIASESELGLFPSHSNFAADLSHCLTWLEAQNSAPGSFLLGAVDPQAFGVSGHSMGGGCSILAAAADPRIGAVANLAAANTNPSAVAQMAGVQVPVSLIAGSSDSITPVASHGQLMYNAGAAPRLLPLIQGGSHCGFQDFSSFGCDSGPLARADQLRITRRVLTSFFALHLKNDQSVWRLVWGPEGLGAAGITTQGDAGIGLEQMGALEAFGGQQASMSVRITNRGRGPSAFALFVEDSAWSWEMLPQQTEVVEPGAMTTVLVRTAVPAGNETAIDRALLSARSLANAGARGFISAEATRRCRADLDRSGSLNIDDFTAMINLYAIQSPDADINVDGLLNIEDFTAFINAYAIGCG